MAEFRDSSSSLFARRVRPSVDLDEFFDAHFGVDLCRLEFLVAEELLDEADVGPTFEHVGVLTLFSVGSSTFQVCYLSANPPKKATPNRALPDPPHPNPKDDRAHEEV